ncbi:MAG: glycolate oxidase subunit GlcE [Gammaproteobacteria bacterium]|nr:MAG: glycolate oxidase subunit GlcE [Gammaproteobacteria bacterium]
MDVEKRTTPAGDVAVDPLPQAPDSADPAENDRSEALLAAVNEARAQGRTLWIRGRGQRGFIGRSAAAARAEGSAVSLSLENHRGIVRHEPTELFVTVRAGTPVDELQTALASEGQMLPFEAPSHGGGSIGGAIACGLSGPRRPFAGAARDHLLGCRFINGRGECLSVGGEVMKNVAGYDLSRLHAGAYGTLGVLLEVSLKVVPVPAASVTIVLAQGSDAEAIAAVQPRLRQPWPITGVAIIDSCTYIRLEGAEPAVAAARVSLGGDTLVDADAFWSSLRELEHGFFAGARDADSPSADTLWRLALPPQAPTLSTRLGGRWLNDWAGALRWYRGGASADTVFETAAAAGGHAICCSPSLLPAHAFQPLSAGMQALQARVKASLDPEHLFNPSRFIV